MSLFVNNFFLEMNLLIKEIQEIEKQIQTQVFEITLQKRRLIKEFNYDEAENCEYLISEMRSQENEMKKQKVHHYFQDEINNIYNRSKTAVTSLKLQKRQNEQQIKNSISNTYQRIQKKSKTEIANAESEYEKQKQLQTSRPVPEATFLLNQSQKAAFQGNYSEARRLKAESESIAENEMRKRMETLEQTYQSTIQKILESSKEELNSLSQKMNEMLNETISKSEKMIQEEENRLQDRFIMHLQDTAKFIYQKCKQEDQQQIYIELRDIMEKTLTQIGIPIPDSLYLVQPNTMNQLDSSTGLNKSSSSFLRSYSSFSKAEE